MLGLGLSVSAAAIMSLKGYDPVADLRTALIELWDMERPDLMTFPTGRQVSSFRGVKAGTEFVQSISASRPVWDPKCFGGVLNRVTYSQDQNSSWGLANGAGRVVGQPSPDGGNNARDYTSDPTGLGGFVTTNGFAFALNTTYTRSAIAKWISGSPRLLMAGNTGTTQITANFNLVVGQVASTSPGTTAAMISLGDGWYLCLWTFTTAASGTPDGARVQVFDSLPNSATRIWQVETRAETAWSGGMIVTNGAAAWGNGRPGLIGDGGDDEMTLATIPPNWPTGAAPCDIFGVLEQEGLASDGSVTRRFFEYGGGSANNGRLLTRAVVTGVNRASAFSGNGSSAIQSAQVATEFSGRHVMRGKFSPTHVHADLNGIVSGAPVPSIPATGAARARLFAQSNPTPGNHWLGKGNLLALINTASPDWTPEAEARFVAHCNSRLAA